MGDYWLAIPSALLLPRRYCCSTRSVDGKRRTLGAPYPGVHESRRNLRFAGDGSAELRLRLGRLVLPFTRPTSGTGPGIFLWSDGMLPSLPVAPCAEREPRYECNARWPSPAGISGIVRFLSPPRRIPYRVSR